MNLASKQASSPCSLDADLGKRQAAQLDDLTEEWNCWRELVAVIWSERQTHTSLVAEHAGPVTHKVTDREDIEEEIRRWPHRLPGTNPHEVFLDVGQGIFVHSVIGYTRQTHEVEHFICCPGNRSEGVK